MGFFSRSSSDKHKYKHGHYGSKHYKKKGLIDNIFNILNSSSRSHRKYREHNKYFGESFHKQNTNGSIICSRCKTPNSHEAKFCNSCGEKMISRQYCPNCGKDISPNDSFCSSCGKKV
ncbi:hypothetical protein Curi_c08240 [Gottschalkia acidurici 9a]|uniref:DZANK-type domain-containing protein n=1 Tax=Gottschalkia acidurici (strain ATCC 7906 / DSM 604 / BCRC 14475 / CIP 104303 / KCTC 5404 / NCIMB 10678 / 9a) TaxID=1128398 RepID=K0AYQ1_GOTA9|nr:zinc ribbon domain-containing protein [Gottschalkia acidurici]AFS77897.1 hypothetical protein Curi_c08240 [Gottschalkia acidurici 9a]